MRTRAVLLLAFVCSCLGTGEGRECLPGDTTPSCKGQESDADVLLQSRTIKEESELFDAEEDGVKIHDESMLDEIEDAEDEDEDEDEEGVAQECDPCDTACVQRTNLALFQKCDADENDRLTASEVQKCLKFHEKPEDEPEDLSLTEEESRSLTDDGASQWLSDYDEDKDGELTQEEFAKSIGGDACPSLLEANQTSEEETQEETTGSCDLGKIMNSKCFSDRVKQGCLTETGEVISEADWALRNGGRVGKIGKFVKKAASCVVSWVTKFVSCVGDIKFPSFTGCFKSLQNSKLGSKWSNVFPSCSNVDDCKKKLLDIDFGFNPNDISGAALDGANTIKTGASKLFTQIGKDIYTKAKQEMDSKMNSDKGGKLVNGFYSKAQDTARALKNAMTDVGEAILDFILGSLKQISNYNIVQTWCSKDFGKHSSGPLNGQPKFGFWYMKPTDCGTFNALKNAFNVKITKTRDLSGWNNAVRDFGNNIAAVGNSLQACVRKTGVLKIPTPFMDLKIANWCVPQPLRIIINGVLGTFQYVFDQVNAAVNGCKDSSQPVCKLTIALQTAARDLVSNFKSSLLQTSGAIVGEKLHGNATRYTADCNAEDFKVFVLGKVRVRFPPWNDQMSLGVKFANGCKDKKYFWDFFINVAGNLFIAGYADPDKFFPAKIERKNINFVVDIGFSVGTPHDDWNTDLPGTDVVQWLAGFTLAASVGFGKKVTIGLGLGIRLLPSPDYPRGFTISPKFGLRDTLLQVEGGQQRVDEAVADAADPVDATLKAATSALTDMSKMDLGSEPLMSAIEDGADAMAAHQEAGVPPLELDSLAVYAGLSVDFCLTCRIKK